MIRRFLQAVLLLIFLIIGYGISLIPLMLVRPHLPVQPFVSALTAWAIIYLVPLPVILRMIIRKAWFFEGKGIPVTREQLETRLLGINELESPVIVNKKGERLNLSWRCKEPQWCERMVVQGTNKQYELCLRFNDNTRTVVLSDRTRALNLALCPIKVKTSWLASPRFYCRVQTGEEWGLNVLKQAASEYRFKPQELKSPVFNMIINSGWNVRFDFY